MPVRRQPGRVRGELDQKVQMAVLQFLSILVWCRCDPMALLREISKHCRLLARHKARKDVSQDWGEMGHVLTLWFTDPECLDSRGRPRPLPLSGRGLSIETLARRVDPKLDAKLVLPYLQSGGGIQRRGKRYVPRGQMLILSARAQNTRILRGVFGHIGTLYHNLSHSPGQAKWFERHSRNHRFPASAMEAFEREEAKRFEELLLQCDKKLALWSEHRRKRERLVTLGFGGYKFVEKSARAPPPTRLEARPRSRRR